MRDQNLKFDFCPVTVCSEVPMIRDMIRSAARSALLSLLKEAPPATGTHPPPAVNPPSSRLSPEAISAALDEAVALAEEEMSSAPDLGLTSSAEGVSTFSMTSSTTFSTTSSTEATDEWHFRFVDRIRRLRDQVNWPTEHPDSVERWSSDEIKSSPRLQELGVRPGVRKYPYVRPAEMPRSYVVKGDGSVRELVYAPHVSHAPVEPEWRQALRQTLPEEMLDRHDYYASFNMAGWYVPYPNGDKKSELDDSWALVYWSPNPKDWADAWDRPVMPWPQEDEVLVGPPTLDDYEAMVDQTDDAQTMVRLACHRVVDWSHELRPANNAPTARRLPRRPSAPRAPEVNPRSFLMETYNENDPGQGIPMRMHTSQGRR